MQLTVASRDDLAYAQIIWEPKTDVAADLQQVARLGTDMMIQAVPSAQITRGPMATTVGGHPAVQHEVRGETGGTGLVWLHTAVETPTGFMQVIAWTTPSQFPARQAALQQIVSSVTER